MRLFKAFGFAAAAAVSLSGGMAMAVQDAHRCLITVQRGELPGTYALTRLDLVDGGCTCLLRTGPAEKQPDAIELQIKTLQSTGTCPEAIKVSDSSRQFSDNFNGQDSSTGDLARNGSLLGGLLALAANGSGLAGRKKPDSPGG